MRGVFVPHLSAFAAGFGTVLPVAGFHRACPSAALDKVYSVGPKNDLGSSINVFGIDVNAISEE